MLDVFASRFSWFISLIRQPPTQTFLGVRHAFLAVGQERVTNPEERPRGRLLIRLSGSALMVTLGASDWVLPARALWSK